MSVEDFFNELRKSRAEIKPDHPANAGMKPEYLVDFERFKPNMIKAAATARDNAYSHRGFKVGCCLMTKTPDIEKGEYDMKFSYNFTPTPKKRIGQDKRCAERNAIEGALAHDISLIVAIATVSKEAVTGENDKAHDVLHPCKECRDLLREMVNKGVLSNESIILNVRDDGNTNSDKGRNEEQRTIGQLLEIYKDDLKADK